jgi:preprotein translocase subunit Sec63
MAASVFDPFQVLGVARGATKQQIRAAYRELVGRYHPDKHRGNPLEELAAAKLVEINRAYDILSDDRRRAAYEGQPSSVVSPPGSRASVSPQVSVPDRGMKILRGVGLLLTLVFFLRFGLALGGQLLSLARGLLLGIFSLFRSGPIPAIVILVVIGMLTSFLLRSRKKNQ